MVDKFSKFWILPFSALFFLAAWSSYERLLQLVTTGVTQRIVFFSVQESFNHRLLASLSFALVGALIGLGALLSSRFSAVPRYGRSLTILLFAAVFAMSVWIAFLTKKISAFGKHLTTAPGSPETVLRLSDIHLYEIGIFGSVCVVIMSIILTKRENQPPNIADM